jgi:hypothetical protein
MATATSRKAKPDPKLLKRRRAIAEKRLELEIKLGPDYAAIAKLDAELKEIATETGDSYKEDFGERGYVSASGRVEAELKGEVPVVQSEAWLALKEIDRKRLIKSGLVKVEEQWGKASNGRVTVKAL